MAPSINRTADFHVGCGSRFRAENVAYKECHISNDPARRCLEFWKEAKDHRAKMLDDHEAGSSSVPEFKYGAHKHSPQVLYTHLKEDAHPYLVVAGIPKVMINQRNRSLL